MTSTNSVYIALGSNKGNKLQNLQLALDAIYNSIGVISKISKVYTTPALGFDGDDFYNACITVETELKPRKILKELQSIESKLGRAKKRRLAMNLVN